MAKLQINTIEKLKNILIVVLVITAVLLLYFLWGSKSLEAFIFNETPATYEVLGTEKILVPSQVVLCRGNEDYTISFSKKDDLWNNQILGAFKSFSGGANILVEEITEEQYRAVMQYSSIVAKFEYNIPFTGFCEKYGIKPPQGYEAISNLTQLGFSQGSDESAFVFDGSKKKYYRLVGSKKIDIFEQIDVMLEEQGYTTYYTLKTFLGTESTNNTLIPLELPMALSAITYEKDTEMDQKDIIEGMAQAYFGSTFDFVRQVEEANGTTIYMYGYGQRVLIINPNDGSIEYKEESKYSQSETLTLFDVIDTALVFVGSHGGFETVGGQQIEPYIESVSQIDDKKDGFRVNMSFLINGNKLFYEESAPIIVEVTDGQVSYFRRELINFDVIASEQVSDKEPLADTINMLANNYEHMKTTLLKRGVIDKEQAETISFEDIANKIDNLYIGYLKPKPEVIEGEIPKDIAGELVPVWVVSIKGNLLYFDLYDGEPKGVSVSQ